VGLKHVVVLIYLVHPVGMEAVLRVASAAEEYIALVHRRLVVSARSCRLLLDGLELLLLALTLGQLFDHLLAVRVHHSLEVSALPTSRRIPVAIPTTDGREPDLLVLRSGAQEVHLNNVGAHPELHLHPRRNSRVNLFTSLGAS